MADRFALNRQIDLAQILDGIHNKADPDEPRNKDIYALPPEELAKMPQIRTYQAGRAARVFVREGQSWTLQRSASGWMRLTSPDSTRPGPHSI